MGHLIGFISAKYPSTFRNSRIVLAFQSRLKTWGHLYSNIIEEYCKWLRNLLGYSVSLSVPSQRGCERHSGKVLSKCFWKEFVIVLLGTFRVQGLYKRLINTAARQ